MYLRLLWLFLRHRTRPRLSIWDTARTRFRVSLTDLDALGHMNNGTYLTLMDLGRMDLMLRSGVWRLVSERDWYPVVAGQTISYRRSLNPGQRFDLYTRFLGFVGTWCFMEQTFCVGETVHAQAVVRARFLRKQGGSVDTAELAALIEPAPAGRVVPDWALAWNDATKPPTGFDAAGAR
ncbi:acyl-CoA thioesterase [Propioniciclava coleopterorum]|nr:acyl-CoA thioesterase [Propioniciclava coleopterorum]